MRRLLAVLLALPACAPLGCFPARPPQDVRAAPPAEAGAPDLVDLYVAVVERPAGDYDLNHDVWQLADEQNVAGPDGPAPEQRRKQALADNGLRVGQVGGLLPARLQALVESGRCSSPPQVLRRRAGDAAVLALGPARPLCRFRLRHEGDGDDVELTQAQCEVEVTPTLVG